ncbi:unnamed protein product [Periconia digitata]|uniref:protein-tyrosine-phosphatase n=1 Tax=Periconia digitata TaxID=1303443 RepID=A0A9W4U692_9PLEO|nr:unnamed protein product [Periconia digitata]
MLEYPKYTGHAVQYNLCRESRQTKYFKHTYLYSLYTSRSMAFVNLSQMLLRRQCQRFGLHRHNRALYKQSLNVKFLPTYRCTQLSLQNSNNRDFSFLIFLPIKNLCQSWKSVPSPRSSRSQASIYQSMLTQPPTAFHTRQLKSKISITVPQSPDILEKYNITHILSLTDKRDCPTFDPNDTRISHLHIDIQDNPMEDLLVCLDGLCAWIAHALAASNTADRSLDPLNGVQNHGEVKAPRSSNVLVHCVMGVSRSGAIIVAYIMRALNLSYDDALALARMARRRIAPNNGFAEQLRVWKELDYSVFEMVKEGVDVSVFLKREYDDWDDNRGVLHSRAEFEKRERRVEKVRRLVVEYGMAD